MAEKKQVIGRPFKAHAPGTDVTVSVLMPAELKMQLQEKALEARRTLSTEAVLRLERSFEPTVKSWQREFGELAGGLGHRVALAVFLHMSAPDHPPFRDLMDQELEAVRWAIEKLKEGGEDARRAIDKLKEGKP